MRLDVYLSENSLADSRTEAKNFVVAGCVTVDGKTVTKPSYDVPEGACVSIDKSSKKYVGRGGLKLEAALVEFDVNPRGALALDIGASSGGFTDCLLQNGATHVIAVDSGSGQMAESLRLDSRITVIENYNARYMEPSDFDYAPTLAVMDVSFISATYVMPAVRRVLAPGGDFICLIKPQFEVGRSGLGKGGIVKDDRTRRSALDKVRSFAESIGFKTVKTMVSPIVGGDGNIEFLAHFVNAEEL